MSRLTPRKINAVFLIIVGIGLCVGATAIAGSLGSVGVSSFLLALLHLAAALSILPILLGIHRLVTSG